MISIGSFRYRSSPQLFVGASGAAPSPAAAPADDVADADTGADDGPSGVACVASVAAAAVDSDAAADAVVVAKVANGFEARVEGEPSAFGALIGQQGRVKRQLESESAARFDVPASERERKKKRFVFCARGAMMRTFLGFQSHTMMTTRNKCN